MKVSIKFIAWMSLHELTDVLTALLFSIGCIESDSSKKIL